MEPSFGAALAIYARIALGRADSFRMGNLSSRSMQRRESGVNAKEKASCLLLRMPDAEHVQDCTDVV
jgi:hypothetical protein